MKKEQVCYVCTGRLGDILNILPICAFDSQSGMQPALMVAKEFAPILDGVSYVDPEIFEGHWLDLRDAVFQAKDKYQYVKVAQVAGPRETVLKEAYQAAGLNIGDLNLESFAKDQWRVVGRLQDVRLNLPLEFDCRDPKREQRLLDGITILPNKRLMLVSTGGKTSPFPYARMVKSYVKALLHGSHYQVIDLDEIKAERFYDLLALYEKAWGLIATDSAPLHLANAAPKLPVIALTQDKPSMWHGSYFRQNWIATIRYRDIDNLVVINERLSERFLEPRFRTRMGPSIIHVYSLYFYIEELYEKARTNWRRFARGYNDVIPVPIDRGTFGRDTTTVFKDAERLPYVKDVIRAATFGRREDDIILLTRPEACLATGALEWIKNADLPVCGARFIKERTNRPGTVHSATDLFAFTVKWWREHQREYPDLIMGGDPHWHRVLAEVIKANGGERRLDLTFRPAGGVPAKDGAWRGFNANIAKQWLAERGITDDLPKVEHQTNAFQINPVGLFPFGYNPSIVPAGNSYIMVYRSHRWSNAKTCLAAAILNEHFEVRTNNWLTLEPENVSTEDGRLFYHKGSLYLSYVVSNYPDNPAKAHVIYGEVINNHGVLGLRYRHRIEPPFPQAIEKNWIFFSWEDRLFVFYSSDPRQVCWEVEGDKIIRIWEHAAAGWPWGPVRGGTHPIMVGNRLVRLFHSTTYHDTPPVPWRYYVGAMECRPEPPFDCMAISEKPILGGSKDYATESQKCPHYKANVIFPGNWWESNGKLKIAAGINDCMCYLIDLDPTQIVL